MYEKIERKKGNQRWFCSKAEAGDALTCYNITALIAIHTKTDRLDMKSETRFFGRMAPYK